MNNTREAGKSPEKKVYILYIYICVHVLVWHGYDTQMKCCFFLVVDAFKQKPDVMCLMIERRSRRKFLE